MAGTLAANKEALDDTVRGELFPSAQGDPRRVWQAADGDVFDATWWRSDTTSQVLQAARFKDRSVWRATINDLRTST